MRLVLTLPVFALFGLVCAATDEAPPKGDLARFQGVWSVDRIEFGGRPLSWLDIEEIGPLDLKGDKIKLKNVGGVQIASIFATDKKGARPVLEQILADSDDVKPAKPWPVEITVAVDSKATPKQIELKIMDLGRGGREFAFSGIYEDADDKLRLCISSTPGQRPTEFKSDRTPVITLVRAKAMKSREQARAKAAQAELKKLQGTWQVVGGGFDRTPLGDKDRASFQLVFDGSELAWKEAGSEVKLKTRVDPASQPDGAIDLLPTSKAYKGRKLRCVYQLDGDRLLLRIPYHHALHRPEKIDFGKQEEVPVRDTDARLILKRKK